MKVKHLSLFISLLILTLTACGKQPIPAMSSTPSAVQKPEAGKAIVTGEVYSTTTKKPLKTTVWLAQVYRQGDQVVYVVDAASSPGIYADDNGKFIFLNIDPHEYVIMIGSPEGQNEVISDGTGKAKVWNIPANDVFNTGELKVKLSK